MSRFCLGYSFSLRVNVSDRPGLFVQLGSHSIAVPFPFLSLSLSLFYFDFLKMKSSISFGTFCLPDTRKVTKEKICLRMRIRNVGKSGIRVVVGVEFLWWQCPQPWRIFFFLLSIPIFTFCWFFMIFPHYPTNFFWVYHQHRPLIQSYCHSCLLP